MIEYEKVKEDLKKDVIESTDSVEEKVRKFDSAFVKIRYGLFTISHLVKRSKIEKCKISFG